MTELEDAAAELDAITRRYNRAKQRLDPLREPAAEAVVRCLQLGMKPGEATGRSPFTASYVRALARDAGIEGDQRYNRTASDASQPAD